MVFVENIAIFLDRFFFVAAVESKMR